MNFDCCSTTNRKKGKGIKLPESTQSSDKKVDHPLVVNCSYAGCLIDDIPFSKIKKIARLGSRYYYFCDEFCYWTWLRSPNTMWL